MSIESLSLGTVQLGMSYGISNKVGELSQKDAHKILSVASEGGVRNLDTAQAYGVSEEIIGQFCIENPNHNFQIVTKLFPGAGIRELDCSAKDVEGSVKEYVLNSLHNLKVDCLDYCLLHNWSDYKSFNGVIWKTLLDLKDQGSIQRLGTSVYSVDDAIEALEDKNIEFIQIPFNLLDRRWHSNKFPDAVMKRKRFNPDFIIQARSIYLQGLLVSPIKKPIHVEGFNQEELFMKLDGLVKSFGRKNRQDLCLSYVRAQKWIDSFVIGAETTDQLNDNIKLFNNVTLDHNECKLLEKEFSLVSNKLLDPSQWNKV